MKLGDLVSRRYDQVQRDSGVATPDRYEKRRKSRPRNERESGPVSTTAGGLQAPLDCIPAFLSSSCRRQSTECRHAHLRAAAASCSSSRTLRRRLAQRALPPRDGWYDDDLPTSTGFSRAGRCPRTVANSGSEHPASPPAAGVVLVLIGGVMGGARPSQGPAASGARAAGRGHEPGDGQEPRRRFRPAACRVPVRKAASSRFASALRSEAAERDGERARPGLHRRTWSSSSRLEAGNEWLSSALPSIARWWSRPRPLSGYKRGRRNCVDDNQTSSCRISRAEAPASRGETED